MKSHLRITNRHGATHRSGALRAWWVVAIAALVSTTAIGCATQGTPAPTAVAPHGTPATSDPPPMPTTSIGCDSPSTFTARSAHVDMSIETPSGSRTYKLYVPARFDGRPAPLVVDLHGYLSGASGQVAMSNLAATAESEGFVLATPQGVGPLPYWNAVPHPDLPDDVEFVGTVIDDVGRALCVDPTRVYVDGFSNGAFLASLVACRLSDRVAAVAAVAGLMLPADCDPVRPIPILAIHGTEDRFVTFDGSPNTALTSLPWDAESTRAFTDLRFAPVTESLGGWAMVDGCEAQAIRRSISASVTRFRHEGCEGGAVVELYVVAGAGHTWPSSAFAQVSESMLGPATTEVDANEVIWEFFADHALAR